MKGLVKKKAVIEATKSLFVKGWMNNYSKVVPCEVKFNLQDLDNEKVFIEIKCPPTSNKFSLQVLKKHVFVQHKSIKHSIPLHLWKAAEDFSNLRRIARREEAIYEGEVSAPKNLNKNFTANGYNGPAVIELCFDKGIYECDFCHASMGLTKDHTIPLSWKYSRASLVKDFVHNIKVNSNKNLQVLCASCHTEKTKFQRIIIQLIKENSGYEGNPVDTLISYCSMKKEQKEGEKYETLS